MIVEKIGGERGLGDKEEFFNLAIVIGYLAFPVVLWIVLTGNFIVEDSYFYLVTARNFALTGSPTFSGLYITNGVHPLWFLALSAWSVIVAAVHAGWLFHPAHALPLSIALLAGGTWNFVVAARTMRINSAVLLIPPLGLLTLFSVLYSEAHMSFFALSLLARLSVAEADGGRPRPYLIGVAVALVFLARLDHVFLVMAFFPWYLFITRDPGRVAKAGAVALVLAGAYLLSNLVWFGGLVPVSGYLKSAWPHLRFHYYPVTLFHPLLGFMGYQPIVGVAPILVALALAWRLRRRLSAVHSIMYVWLFGALGHFLYIVFFAKENSMGYWYYLLPMLAGSLAFAIWLSCLRVPTWLGRTLALTAAGLLTVAVAWDKIEVNEAETDGWSARNGIEFLRGFGLSDRTVLCSEMPGSLAFYTNARVIAADLLTANRNLLRQMLSSPDALQYLFDYAKAQGHPIEYVIYTRGHYLWPRDAKTLEFYNPKEFPRLVKVGERRVGPPMYLHARPGARPFIVWKVPDDPEGERKISPGDTESAKKK